MVEANQEKLSGEEYLKWLRDLYLVNLYHRNFAGMTEMMKIFDSYSNRLENWVLPRFQEMHIKTNDAAKKAENEEDQPLLYDYANRIQNLILEILIKKLNLKS